VQQFSLIGVWQMAISDLSMSIVQILQHEEVKMKLWSLISEMGMVISFKFLL